MESSPQVTHHRLPRPRLTPLTPASRANYVEFVRALNLMGAFVNSMKALFSAVLTGGVFVLAVTAMTGCASAEQERRWQIEAIGGTTSPTERAAARRRAWEARRAARERREESYEERRRREIRRARIIRTAPVVSEHKCQATLAAVGDQYASEQGAQQEADKAWMQTARWQYGERFMSRENADDAAYECGRSSVGSVVGQVFYRCRLTAKPCRPDKSQGK
jgi:hypothetical protein